MGVMGNERFLDGEQRNIKMTREEASFAHSQLSARKTYFEEDMVHWAEKKDVKEVLRCAEAIKMIEKIQQKILA